MNLFGCLLFLVALAVVAEAEAPHDQRSNAELADKVITELQAGQFDALEEQYSRFSKLNRYLGLPWVVPHKGMFTQPGIARTYL